MSLEKDLNRSSKHISISTNLNVSYQLGHRTQKWDERASWRDNLNFHMRSCTGRHTHTHTVYADIWAKKLQTPVCSAGSDCGNFLWASLQSNRIDSFDLVLIKGRGVGSMVPCCSPSASHSDEASVHNANHGNDDEESISDYEVLSHMVRRWRRVMQGRRGWSEMGKYRTDTHTDMHGGNLHLQICFFNIYENVC